MRKALNFVKKLWIKLFALFMVCTPLLFVYCLVTSPVNTIVTFAVLWCAFMYLLIPTMCVIFLVWAFFYVIWVIVKW